MNDLPRNLTPLSPSVDSTLPRSVLCVALILILFIGLLTLEISDSFFRQDHHVARSLFVLPVPIMLLWGLLARHRWAWQATRALTLLTAILYTLPSLAVWFVSPHLPIGQRLWITAVGVVLFTLALSAFFALGRRPARAYFRANPNLETEH